VNKKKWMSIAGVVVALLLLAMAGCIVAEKPVARDYQTACYMTDGGDKWVCGTGGEIELQDGAILDVQDGVTVSMEGGTVTGDQTITGTMTAEQVTSTDDAMITDDVTIGGDAAVTGTVSAEHITSTDDALITDDATIGGDATVTGTVTAEHVTSTDDATITDDLNVNGNATISTSLTVSGTSDLQGNLTLENDETISNSTDGRVVINGQLGSLGLPITTSTSYTATTAESGATFANVDATGEITLTLPAASAGLQYCVYVHAAYTMTLKLNNTDQIHHLTNSAGDRLQNAGTAGDSVCLLALDDAAWIPLQETGTWSDAD
jgi:hypothetical protein